MNTPIPTPFDIIEPGPGALVPTGLAWLALLLCAGVVLGAIAIMRRVPRAPSVNTTIRNLVDQLRRTRLEAHDQSEIERATRLARLIISPFLTSTVDTMSCAEIRSLADTLKDRSYDSDRSLAAILSLLAELEELSYAPLNSARDPDLSAAILDRLTSAIESHLGRFKPL
jgi:hypothetical protein